MADVPKTDEEIRWWRIGYEVADTKRVTPQASDIQRAEEFLAQYERDYQGDRSPPAEDLAALLATARYEAGYFAGVAAYEGLMGMARVIGARERAKAAPKCNSHQNARPGECPYGTTQCTVHSQRSMWRL